MNLTVAILYTDGKGCLQQITAMESLRFRSNSGKSRQAYTKKRKFSDISNDASHAPGYQSPSLSDERPNKIPRENDVFKSTDKSTESSSNTHSQVHTPTYSPRVGFREHSVSTPSQSETTIMV